MNNYKPLIGITPGYDYDKKMLFVKEGYYEGINRAGGLAMTLPIIDSEETLFEIIERCDGFLITGGPDIDATYFGENNLEFSGEISPYRDSLELALIKRAFKLNKPIFGICRGVQVLNVAFGGTLYQDINAQVKNDNLIKHSQTAPKWYATHDVYLEKESKLRGIFNTETIAVNSFHHQAIKDVAKEFVVTAIASDGIIEAIEHKNQSFTIGVQWHPELMWKKNQEFLKLFEEFVRYAAIGK